MPFVVLSQTSETSAWTGTALIPGYTELYDGLTIRCFLPYNSTSAPVTLALAVDTGGSMITPTTLPVYWLYPERLTTQITQNAIFTLTYRPRIGSIGTAMWLCNYDKVGSGNVTGDNLTNGYLIKGSGNNSISASAFRVQVKGATASLWNGADGYIPTEELIDYHITSDLIGTSIQRHSTELTAIAALTPSEGYLHYNGTSFEYSAGTGGAYLPLAGGTMTGQIMSQNIIPKSDRVYDLGNGNNGWASIRQNGNQGQYGFQSSWMVDTYGMHLYKEDPYGEYNIYWKDGSNQEKNVMGFCQSTSYHDCDIVMGENVMFNPFNILLTGNLKYGNRMGEVVVDGTGNIGTYNDPFTSLHVRNFYLYNDNIPAGERHNYLPCADGSVVSKAALSAGVPLYNLEFTAGIFNPKTYNPGTSSIQVRIPVSTDHIGEGYSNKFFTEVRARQAVSNYDITPADVLPHHSNQYTLGSSSYAWKELYLADQITGEVYKITVNNGALSVALTGEHGGGGVIS